MTGVTAISAGWSAGTGGGGTLDTQTVTTGASGNAVDLDRIRGWYQAGGLGSISDGTSNIYGGAAITEFFWNENGGTPEYQLTITGATNTGWTQVVIGGTKTLTRSSASFGSGTWIWSTSDTAGSQAFGALGNVKVCVFS